MYLNAFMPCDDEKQSENEVVCVLYMYVDNMQSMSARTEWMMGTVNAR